MLRSKACRDWKQPNKAVVYASGLQNGQKAVGTAMRGARGFHNYRFSKCSNLCIFSSICCKACLQESRTTERLCHFFLPVVCFAMSGVRVTLTTWLHALASQEAGKNYAKLSQPKESRQIDVYVESLPLSLNDSAPASTSLGKIEQGRY